MEDIKEILSKELRFSARDEEKDRWFKSRFFVGIDTKGSRIMITEKGKNRTSKKEAKINVIYKGDIPNTKEDIMKLFTWLNIIKKEDET